MKAWTIKGRLIRSLMAFVALFWVVGVVAAGIVVHHEIEEVFDSALRETTAQVLPVALNEYRLATSKEAPAGGEERRPASLNISRGHMHFRLRDQSGAVLVASQGAPSEVLPLPARNTFYTHGRFRYYARQIEDGHLWIEVAQEQNERLEAATGIWLGLVSPLLALLPIAALAVWHTVARATQPISRLSQELETRGGNHLEPIDVAGVPEELTPVIEGVNTLMLRLEAALASERAFAANAAHELRNPIASARAQIQLLAGNLHGTAASARAENIASQLGQLGRRVEKLLQISRADAGLGHTRERTDLIAIASLIVDEYARRQDVGRRLAFEHGDESLWVFMDPDALAIVVRNAIENAVIHGRAGEPITVTAGDDHSLSVVNASDTVPAEALQDLTRRFRRADHSQVVPGTGLGLAIVDVLMRQAGGTIELLSPASGRTDGFEIVLRFPTAA
jgi:two-component system OmpR family sensor kinase